MTIRLAVSNIALPAFDHRKALKALPELGFTGVEVAPSRAWPNTWKELVPTAIDAYRKQVEAAELTIIGLHSLLFDQKHLGLFKGAALRAETLEFFIHLSAVCRDLGGYTLIWGGGRHRGTTTYSDAVAQTIDFFGELAISTKEHGTCFCLEPLSPKDTDFIHSAKESLAIVEAVNMPSLAVQLDAKALVENNEVNSEIFEVVKPHLVHFHANEPRLAALCDSQIVNHARLGQLLRDVNYDGYVTMEQILTGPEGGQDAVRRSSEILRTTYGEKAPI